MVYETMIASSYEKHQGRYLLSEEISSLAFWQLQDREKRGYLEWEDTRQLMHALRFENVKTEADFANEFKNTAHNYELSQSDSVYKFDLVR